MLEFEKVSRVENVILPKRATECSAGYDFFALEDTILPAKQLTKIMTGVKCKMRPYMFLMLSNRSSNPSKKGLFLANGVGIIDADYYNNPVNEGEIIFEYYNFSDKVTQIKKGEKIGQGIITSYHKVQGDDACGSRTGGFGSTDNK